MTYVRNYEFTIILLQATIEDSNAAIVSLQWTSLETNPLGCDPDSK